MDLSVLLFVRLIIFPYLQWETLTFVCGFPFHAIRSFAFANLICWKYFALAFCSFTGVAGDVAAVGLESTAATAKCCR